MYKNTVIDNLPYFLEEFYVNLHNKVSFLDEISDN